jgi:hypothetical protein
MAPAMTCCALVRGESSSSSKTSPRAMHTILSILEVARRLRSKSLISTQTGLDSMKFSISCICARTEAFGAFDMTICRIECVLLLGLSVNMDATLMVSWSSEIRQGGVFPFPPVMIQELLKDRSVPKPPIFGTYNWLLSPSKCGTMICSFQVARFRLSRGLLRRFLEESG